MDSEKKKTIKKWIVTFLPLLIALILALVVLLVGNRFQYRMELLGDADMTLDYGTPFTEPGALATLQGKVFYPSGKSLSVSVKGSVDPDTVGDYTLHYSAGFLWYRMEATRTVHIVDRIAPEITLVPDPDTITQPGEPYAEKGFAAWDDYDGDLTASVQREERDGVVTYTVADSSGNTAQATREIRYPDTTPPQIRLTGGTELHISLGSRYEEPGFSALDDQDGDVTASVVTEGSVDCRTPGEYTVTYTVSDSSGNAANVTRMVTVETATPPETVTPEGKVIYLTFDDGPGPYTEQLLQVLEKYGAKATFFVVGDQPELLRRIAEGGHSIGIHTYSHNYRSIYSSEDAFFQELYQMQDGIYEATGVWTTLLRFPGGSSNTVSRFNKGIMTRLTRKVQDYGFQYYDWNVDSDDAGHARTSDEVYENVLAGVSVRSVSVVLQHDIKDFSVDAVERILKWGLEHGYTFLPLQPDSPQCHHGVNN